MRMISVYLIYPFTNIYRYEYAFLIINKNKNYNGFGTKNNLIILDKKTRQLGSLDFTYKIHIDTQK